MTVAVNACAAPSSTAALAGDIPTEMGGGGGGPDPTTPPQPRSDATKNNAGCQRDGVCVGQHGLRRIALPSIAVGIARDVPARSRSGSCHQQASDLQAQKSKPHKSNTLRALELRVASFAPSLGGGRDCGLPAPASFVPSWDEQSGTRIQIGSATPDHRARLPGLRENAASESPLD